jgi:hypothetical protein
MAGAGKGSSGSLPRRQDPPRRPPKDGTGCVLCRELSCSQRERPGARGHARARTRFLAPRPRLAPTAGVEAAGSRLVVPAPGIPVGAEARLTRAGLQNSQPPAPGPCPGNVMHLKEGDPKTRETEPMVPSSHPPPSPGCTLQAGKLRPACPFPEPRGGSGALDSTRASLDVSVHFVPRGQEATEGRS